MELRVLFFISLPSLVLGLHTVAVDDIEAGSHLELETDGANADDDDESLEDEIVYSDEMQKAQDDRRSLIRAAVMSATGINAEEFETTRANTSAMTESNVQNCGMSKGAWMGPTVNSDAQKLKVKGWKGLDKIKDQSMTAKLGFVMMIYHTIVFSKSWETLLSEGGGKFSMLIHSKETPKISDFFQKFLYKKDFSNDRCKNAQMMLELMKALMDKDKDTSHMAIISGDTLPIKPLSHMYLDLDSTKKSRFCADTEWNRAETYFVMRRDQADFMHNNMKTLIELIPTVDGHKDTDCLDEDTFYWPLNTRGEKVVNSCPMMTDWTGTDKFWKRNAARCHCPDFISSNKVHADCGRPSLFHDISFVGLDELFSSPGGYWFVRKFPGDGIPGTVTYNTGQSALDPAVAMILQSMRAIPAMPLPVID